MFEDGIISVSRMHAGVKHSVQTQRREISLRAMSAPTKKDAIKVIREELPFEYLIHGESIERNISKMFTPEFTHKYSLDDFTMPEVEDRSKALLFYGPSGIGKTQFALAHFKTPLLVRHLDKLKDLDPEKHDGIVFDDMSFWHRPITDVIHLLDMEEDTDVHVRYGLGHIPQKMPRIFTFNHENPFWDEDKVHSEEHKKAILRRVVRIHFSPLGEKLY